MKVLVCLVIGLWISLTQAQIKEAGKFNSVARQIYFGKRLDSEALSQIKVQVPFHDSKVLLENEEKAEKLAISGSRKTHTGPLAFAKAIPIQIDSHTQGVWQEDLISGLRTWSVMIESQTAYGIALIFDHFRIFEDGEMYVINDSVQLGAFTKANNKPDGKFAIQQLKGSSVFIIYIEPLKSVKVLNCFKIGKIVHTYRDIFTKKSASGACNIDSRCTSTFVR